MEEENRSGLPDDSGYKSNGNEGDQEIEMESEEIVSGEGVSEVPVENEEGEPKDDATTVTAAIQVGSVAKTVPTSKAANGKRKNTEGAKSGAKQQKKEIKVSWYVAMAMMMYESFIKHLLPQKDVFEQFYEDYKETYSECVDFVVSPDKNFVAAEGLMKDSIVDNKYGPSNLKEIQKGKTPMPLLTELNTKLKNAKHEEISKTISESVDQNRNMVYNSDGFRFSLKTERRNIFEDNNFDKIKGPECSGPTPIEVLDCYNTTLTWDEIRKALTGKTSCILRGIGKYFGLDCEKFEPHLLANLIKGKAEVMFQKAQSIHENENLKKSKEETAWKMGVIKKYDNLKEIVVKQAQRMDLVKKAMLKIPNNLHKASEIVEKLEIKLKEQNKSDLGTAGKTSIISAFATNIDLDDGITFSEQAKEIEKLPKFLQPKQGLMRHIDGIIAGITAVQVYIKEIGARTAAHVENQCVASLNLNIGAGDCVWYIVSALYAARMEELLRKQKCWPYGPYWPLEETLIKENIPFQKVLQKPDDMIYIGVGSYHWVQANGPCVNISWNIAEETAVQLAGAALDFDHVAEQRYKTNIPLVSMLWKIAEEKNEDKKADLEFYQMTRNLLISSLTRCMFEENLLISQKCEVKPISELQKSARYGAYEDRSVVHCKNKAEKGYYICRSNLFNFIALQTEVDKDGNEIIVPRCVDCMDKKKNPEVFRRYEIQELKDIFAALSEYIDSKTPSAPSDDPSASSDEPNLPSSEPSTSSSGPGSSSHDSPSSSVPPCSSAALTL